MKLPRSPLVRLVAIAVLQVMILISIVGFRQYTIWTSETVLLRVAAIQPRNFQSGDYVRLQYDISTMDSSARNRDGDTFFGTVYVELKEGDDGYWHAIAIHDRHERQETGTVLIRGNVGYPFYDPDVPVIGSKTYDITYGIEGMIVTSDGTAPASERASTAVEVKVDRFGQAKARLLFVDGEAFELKGR
jgi:uncharacterized membrane-anchored protein